MKTIGFGIIGCGLMGREFASAAARWCHLTGMDVRPQPVALCDPNPAVLDWYRGNFDSVELYTDDYAQLLAHPGVDAVYIAVPHNLHQEIYCAAIEAGKAVMGEKPFGIDEAANAAILATLQRYPDAFVRCSSEFPFYPAMQRLGTLIEQEAFGTLLEVNCGFLHSSDLDVNKPINWKRQVETNGEYGCLGDLGLHACHMPLRAGWPLYNARSVLSNVVPERPDKAGNRVPCATWDNATVLVEAACPRSGNTFPLTLKTQRIAPGQRNTWYCEVLGTAYSARFSTANCNVLQFMDYQGGEQVWSTLDAKHDVTYASITGPIFEFGFSDAILQMWAAFVHELEHGAPQRKFAGCITPEETRQHHEILTAALVSHKERRVVELTTTNAPQ